MAPREVLEMARLRFLPGEALDHGNALEVLAEFGTDQALEVPRLLVDSLHLPAEPAVGRPNHEDGEQGQETHLHLEVYQHPADPEELRRGRDDVVEAADGDLLDRVHVVHDPYLEVP